MPGSLATAVLAGIGVVGVSGWGRPFLRAESDGKETNNLLTLPEYPQMQQP